MTNSKKLGEITLLLADRIPLFSSGLQQILMSGNGFSRVDVAEGRKEVMQYLQAFKYDILIMDTRLNDSESLEVLQHIRRLYPNQKVIFLGRMRDQHFLKECIQYGLKGYILRNSSLDKLLLAIQTVHKDSEYFSPEVAKAFYRLIANPIAADSRQPLELLSRELEILRRICDEKCNEEIASDLNISLSMVKKYRSSLLLKTGSKNTAGLIKFAFRQGIMRL